MTGAQLANALNEAAIIAGRAGRDAIAPRGPRRGAAAPVGRLPAGAPPERQGAADRRLPRGRPRALPPAARARPAGDPQHRPARPGARLRRPLAAGGQLPEVPRRAARRGRDPARRARRRGGGASASPTRAPSTTSPGSTLVCKQMVSEFGMGVALDDDGPPPIALPTGDYAVSDQTRRDVDLAAMTLAREAYRRARALLAANRECLDDLAASALERETLTREELDEIFAAPRAARAGRAAGSGAALVAMAARRRRRAAWRRVASLGQAGRRRRAPTATTSPRAARWPAGSTASARSACSTASGRC